MKFLLIFRPCIENPYNKNYFSILNFKYISYVLNLIERSLTCFQVNSSKSEEILWIYHFEGGWNGLNLGTKCLPFCIAEVINLRRFRDAVNSLSGLSGKIHESLIGPQSIIIFFFVSLRYYYLDYCVYLVSTKITPKLIWNYMLNRIMYVRNA